MAGRTAATVRERLFEKIAVDEATGCWVWTAARDRVGYGKFRVGRSMRTAHRAAYELLVGPVPSDLVVDHLCNNPPCVNPKHMRVCTDRENILRSSSPAAVHAKQERCVNDHELSGSNVAIWRGNERTCRECHRVRCQKNREKRACL